MASSCGDGRRRLVGGVLRLAGGRRARRPGSVADDHERLPVDLRGDVNVRAAALGGRAVGRRGVDGLAVRRRLLGELAVIRAGVQGGAVERRLLGAAP